MGFFQASLILATFLCSLVAGFLFAFAIVVMPGIKSLNDKEFIQAFQVIDRVIQNNQPIFILVWVGSAIALITAVVLGIGHLDRIDRWLIVVAVLLYILGVQLVTITINIPLNNKIQALDVSAVNEAAHHDAREGFEPRWNRWNRIRTCLSCLVSALLIVLLFRL
ncbi:MAG: DUF1772 domain-containing protein [Pirellulales bacterium]|nr:DUF1772 domain-containing protein [Pirellulales bacterium]